uniref:Uncharacterized protein n=1 Tax=Glossina austeni TaxID=7395 RepID=A0A1A9VY00_GLOAU
MGLTWIDHDTIEKPVEEFAAVKSKLTKTLYTTMDGNVKPKTTLKLLETHVSEDSDEKSPTTPLQPPPGSTLQSSMSTSSSVSSSGTTASTTTEKNKKLSKLCALL